MFFWSFHFSIGVNFLINVMQEAEHEVAPHGIAVQEAGGNSHHFIILLLMEEVLHVELVNVWQTLVPLIARHQTLHCATEKEWDKFNFFLDTVLLKR